MSDYILRGLLDAKTIYDTPTDVIDIFVRVSTGIVTHKVNEFIAKYINSEDEINRVAAEKLRDAYLQKNKQERYLNSPEARQLVSDVMSIYYNDISANTSLDKLKTYRNQIIEILSEDEEFRLSYNNEVKVSETAGLKSAFTEALDSSNFNKAVDALENMKLSKEFSATEIEALYNITNVIQNNPRLFKNSGHKESQSTIFSSTARRTPVLKNLLKGLDFLIPRLEQGISPIRWRNL